MKWIRPLIYALSGFALYRHWPARGGLWWALLGSSVLMAWTHITLIAAIKKRRAVDLAVALNRRLAATDSVRGATRTVRSWLQRNIVISAIVLALSVWAIVTAR